VISSSQRHLPDNTQKSQKTNIHDSGGIRNHNPKNRAVADPRLRPHGHWDRKRITNNFYLYICVCVCIRIRTEFRSDPDTYTADSLRAGSGRNVLILLASCQQTCMTFTTAVCTKKTPDDGQKSYQKHVEFYSKNKFEKLVHLVGFITRIYHDARSPERQIQTWAGLRNCCDRTPANALS